MALTPRYKNLKSMVEDFYGLLNEMEDLNPKDPTLAKPAKQVARSLAESKQAITEGLNFTPSPFVGGSMASAPHGSYHISHSEKGHQLSYSGGKSNSGTKNAGLGFHASEKDAQTVAGNHHLTQMRTLGSPKVGSAGIANYESKAENAPLSRYTGQKGMIDSFRVLAGLEEQEISPRDPGIIGNTKTAQEMREDYGMAPKKETQAAPTKNGYSVGAARAALTFSNSILDKQNAIHESLCEGASESTYSTLSKACKSAAEALRDIAEGAPDALYNKMSGIADRHDRHAAIYARGKYPKTEAISAMRTMISDVDPTDFLFVVRR